MARFRLGESTYRVELDESDVAAFAERWPCYGERRPLAFVFSRENGDLIEIDGDDSDNDESGIAALANDCAYSGAVVLGLRSVAEMRRPYAEERGAAILAERERLAASMESRI